MGESRAILEEWENDREATRKSHGDDVFDGESHGDDVFDGVVSTNRNGPV